MPFLLSHLQSLLGQCSSVGRLWVGYSGGVDSHVLLHRLAQLSAEGHVSPVSAIHIHHGLSPDADCWADHCQKICREFNIELFVKKVDGFRRPRTSPEQSAREARYQAFQKQLGENDLLLLAHHQDDQAETFLLQALRGAGPDGLSAMPDIKRSGHLWLVRPLLHNSRQSILDYAHYHALDWVQDDSNRDESIDRNFLRHTIIPLLARRWKVNVALSRSSRHTATMNTYLREQLRAELKNFNGSKPRTLSVSRLMSVKPDYASMIVRAHVRQLGKPAPTTTQLEELCRRQLYSGNDQNVLLEWGELQVRRYRDDLYFMAPLPNVSKEKWCLKWDMREICYVPDLGVTLDTKPVTGQGIAVGFTGFSVILRPRNGGEKIRIAGQTHSRKLKNIFQAAGIPIWQRNRMPLVYIDSQLAGITGLCIAEGFQAGLDEPGIDIIWSMGNTLIE